MNIKHPGSRDIPALRRLWWEAFGDGDAFLDAFFATAFDTSRCLTAGEGEAACYWLDCACRGQKIAYLYAVATAKKSRGQGLCRALLEQTRKALGERGYAGVLLVPGDEDLRRMYRKLGFEDACAILEFTLPASAPAPLEKLTLSQYRALRAPLLPEGAAIEGREIMEFLAARADFYRRGDTLCACIREGNRLFIPELLGDKAQASAIAAALGCESVTARTPGGQKPWAMYCPLTASPAPTHFSFALDW